MQHAGSYAPIVESVDHVIHDSGLRPVQLPENMTSDDFTRAVAVATVSALRHQQAYAQPGRARVGDGVETEEAGGHGGHDAPSWSRVTSASVLLACTALYAIIAGEHCPSQRGPRGLLTPCARRASCRCSRRCLGGVWNR